MKLIAFLIAGTFCASQFSSAEPFISQQEKDYVQSNKAAEKSAPALTGTPAQELSVRGGLPHFFTKAKAGQPVRIVYFGGSITAHDGWRPLSFAGLQKMFPQAQMSMVNACVGGSGSLMGVFRADRDLVAQKPDLVFIEFAVNDGSDAAQRTKDVERALEGIIRKVKSANADADLCFVFTMQTANVDVVRKGFCHTAAAVHERVATYYNLPSIYVGPAVVKAIDEGSAVFFGKVADKASGKDADGKLVITEDNTHPVLPTGHAFYADVVLRSMEALSNAPATAANALPAPMYGASWEKAKLIPAEGNATFQGDWQKLTAADGPSCMRFGKKCYEWFPNLYRTAQPGASVTVKFQGSVIGLRGMDGPDSGIVLVKTDDQAPVKDNHFTVYNTRSFYSGKTLPELPEGVHTVQWTLSDEKPDKARILAGKPGNDKDFLENPAKYEANTFSVGEIMIIGDVIP